MLNIIPTPKHIEEREGTLSLSGICAFLSDGCDGRVVRVVAGLCEEIGKRTGEQAALFASEPRGKRLSVRHGECGEGYRLSVFGDGIDLWGDGAAGAFWGVATLMQLVRAYGAEIPFLEISDSPEFSYRGFYHDVTRGRVPTLRKLKEIADLLAALKINSLQLYVEDAFTFKELCGIVTPECALTPSEILELDAYCRERFIELIPSMASFGHLFTLLQSESYNHISELPGHRMTRNYWLERQWHHTVNVYHPETEKVIVSMLEQYIPLFSSEYFNICCDETMDLCNGANAGCDKGEAYFHHLNKLISTVKAHGKKVMMWGDECMARPELFRERVPEDTVILNWCYRREVNEWIPKFFYEQGYSQIVCTGTSCWESFAENVLISTGNIESFAAHAKKYGALGILNTNWGDFGHICPFNCNLYGLLFGAEKSWNPDSETGEDFELSASRLLYGVDINMADTLRALSRASFTANWSEFVIWHSAVTLEGKSIPLDFGGRYSAERCIASKEACRREVERLSSLSERSVAVEDLILSARAIELMNREVLYVNGEAGYTDGAALQRDFDLWLSDYSAAWLRDDKPSQLFRIEEFIRSITKVPVKGE